MLYNLLIVAKFDIWAFHDDIHDVAATKHPFQKRRV